MTNDEVPKHEGSPKPEIRSGVPLSSVAVAHASHGRIADPDLRRAGTRLTTRGDTPITPKHPNKNRKGEGGA
jgi:hypothetical protein